MKAKHLFLDLEDTIITPVTTGWHNTELINVALIRKHILDLNPDFIHIFSFAIWDERELGLFRKHCCPMIEQALGIKISNVPTVDDDIIPACCDIMGLSRSTVTFDDVSSFWSKHESFRLWCRRKFINRAFSEVKVVLLDDAVINETFSWPDLGMTGEIIRIETL
jgi:hypothetical protein